MASVAFDIPEDLWAAFSAAFAGKDIDALVAELMREAVDKAERPGRRRQAVERMLARRAATPVLTLEQRLARFDPDRHGGEAMAAEVTPSSSSHPAHSRL